LAQLLLVLGLHVLHVHLRRLLLQAVLRVLGSLLNVALLRL
jgi:hypothetical protein